MRALILILLVLISIGCDGQITIAQSPLYYTTNPGLPIPPPKPASFDVMTYSGTSHAHANVALRQVALEPATSPAVDVPKSWSVWIEPFNIVSNSQRILGVGPVSNSNLQYGLTINPTNLQTVNQTLNFVIWSSFGGTFIRIISSEKFLKGRWTHVVITYDGSETSAGLNMYINGVLDTGATKDGAGTYTGAQNVSTNRFFTSAVASADSRFGGRLRDLAIWNDDLNQTEVNELFNAGVPIDVNTTSIYAGKIVAYWPLHTTLACLNNSSFDLGTDTGIATSNVPVGPYYETLTIFNAYPPNTKYLAFGGLIKNGSDVTLYTRDGTTHLADGNIVKAVFDPVDLSIPAPTTVIDDATYDLRNANPGILNGTDIVVFSSKFTNPNFIELDRYESTDGLTGETFGSPTAMTTSLAGYLFYGKMVEGYAPGEYWVPEYEATAGTNYNVYIWKYSGGVWTKNTVWTGAPGNTYGEPALLRAGNNTFIMLMRSETVAGLHITYSTDGGSTWSTPAATGLGAGICNADMTLDPYGNIVLVYMDRSTGRLMLSTYNVVADVIANPTDWNTPSVVFQFYSTDSTGALGYPSIVRDGWMYTLAFSAEFSSSRADIIFGYGRLD